MVGRRLLSAFNYIAHFSYALPMSETPIQTQSPTQVSERPNLESQARTWMLAGWLAGWLAVWLAGWLAGWLVGCLAINSGHPFYLWPWQQ